MWMDAARACLVLTHQPPPLDTVVRHEWHSARQRARCGSLQLRGRWRAGVCAQEQIGATDAPVEQGRLVALVVPCASMRFGASAGP